MDNYKKTIIFIDCVPLFGDEGCGDFSGTLTLFFGHLAWNASASFVISTIPCWWIAKLVTWIERFVVQSQRRKIRSVERQAKTWKKIAQEKLYITILLVSYCINLRIRLTSAEWPPSHFRLSLAERPRSNCGRGFLPLPAAEWCVGLASCYKKKHDASCRIIARAFN